MTLEISKQYYLSPLTKDDAKAIYVAMNNPENTQNLSAIPSPYTMKDAEYWVTEGSQQKYTDGKTPLVYAIRDRLKNANEAESGSDLIGSIDIRPSDCVKDQGQYLPHELEDSSERYALFGYWLDPAYRRQGIMSLALTLLIEKVGVEVMGIKKFYGNYLGANEASKGVFTKAGFKYAGIKTQAVEKPGVQGKLDLNMMELHK